mmetsp:Transcript_25725/g.65398  ORF Transcript_25725/g.65398 Transcript_25725/m.65398 type:complete len:205 (+) Transcript_25725:1257-1871(+)
MQMSHLRPVLASLSATMGTRAFGRAWTSDIWPESSITLAMSSTSSACCSRGSARGWLPGGIKVRSRSAPRDARPDTEDPKGSRDAFGATVATRACKRSCSPCLVARSSSGGCRASNVAVAASVSAAIVSVRTGRCANRAEFWRKCCLGCMAIVSRCNVICCSRGTWAMRWCCTIWRCCTCWRKAACSAANAACCSACCCCRCSC